MALQGLNQDDLVFGLDIGTRSIVGVAGYMNRNRFHVVAMAVKEHSTRAMLDGQIHDIYKVEIQSERSRMSLRLSLVLQSKMYVSLLLDAYLKLLINLQRWNLKKRLGLTMNIFIP